VIALDQIVKLLPEGSSVIAVIVVVVLFLKQQREQAKQIEGIANAFNQRIGEVTTNFQQQVDRLANQIFQYEKDSQAQIQRLFDQFVIISKETIAAVVELRSSVEGLSKRVEMDVKKNEPS
jgi:hypothetical protein